MSFACRSNDFLSYLECASTSHEVLALGLAGLIGMIVIIAYRPFSY